MVMLSIAIMNNEIYGLWRAIAGEKLPYTDDLPEPILILPELSDNSISDGDASMISTSVEILSESSAILRVRDNGNGLSRKGQQRLFSMGSKKATDLHHQYGRGAKTAVAKLCPDNQTAKWTFRYRNKNARGHHDCLQTTVAPFIGQDQEFVEDPDDETILMPSGAEWIIEFDLSKLKVQTPKEIFEAIKEMYRTRYSRSHFNKTEFVLEVRYGDIHLKESSKINNWTTFEECVEKEVEHGNAVILHNDTHDKMRYVLYHITVKGNTAFNLKKEFPRYGQKNQFWSRIHISLAGRMIEARPTHKFFRGKGANHNSINGYIGFVNFDVSSADSYPTPSTTKVSFRDDCPIHAAFVETMYKIHDGIKEKSKPDPEPEPAPVEPPKKKPEIGGACDRRMVWSLYIDLDVLKHKCLCCRTLWITRDDFHVGHIISRADGGSDDITNLRPICKTCNLGMKTKNMKEYIIEKGFDKIL
jgi:hypothetical protein